MTDEALTDERITALIEDPALIDTHEIALEVLSCLDTEIANIQVQIDAATIEANVRPLSADRQAWLRRASYAAAMRRNERHRVMQRDKEIRGTKGPAQTSKRQTERDVEFAKNARLKAEAEDRTAKRRQEVTIQYRFFQAAKKMLPQETFQEILRVAEIAGQI